MGQAFHLLQLQPANPLNLLVMVPAIDKGICGGVVIGGALSFTDPHFFSVDRVLVFQEVQRFFNPLLSHIQAHLQHGERYILLFLEVLYNILHFLLLGKSGANEEIDNILVLGAGHQENVGVGDIPSGPANLLVVGDDIGGHLEVNHKCDILLVIAHAQLDSSHKNLEFIPAEALFNALEFGLVPDSGMIGGGFNVPGFQVTRQLVAVPLGQAVDDAAAFDTLQVFQYPGVPFRAALQIQDLQMQGVS